MRFGHVEKRMTDARIAPRFDLRELRSSLLVFLGKHEDSCLPLRGVSTVTKCKVILKWG